MLLNVEIPEELGYRLTADGVDLSRRALEGLALEEYRLGRLSKPELRRLLGFGTRWKLDGFLKEHGVFEDYTIEDFEQERAALKRLGY